MTSLRRFFNWVFMTNRPLTEEELNYILRPYHMDRWI